MSGFSHPLVLPAAIAFGALAVSAATGLAFAGWTAHGAGIFMALAEQGLAWCF